MKLILECHPDVWCYDEHMGYALVAERFSVTPQPTKSWIGFKAPRLTEQIDAPVWIDHDFSARPSCYTHDPIVFMIRSAKDVVASMLRLRYEGVSWIRKWGEPSLHVRMTTDSLIASFCEPVLRSFGDDPDCEVAIAALYWSYKNLALFRYLDAGYPVLCVQYERFVSNPAPALQDICDMLAVPWRPALMQHHRLPHTEIWGNGRAIGGTDPRRAIDDASVGLSATLLSDRATAIVESVAGETERRLWATSTSPPCHGRPR